MGEPANLPAAQVRALVWSAVERALVECCGIPEYLIGPGTRLDGDLGLDDEETLYEVVHELEHELEVRVPDELASSVVWPTLGDLVASVERLVADAGQRAG